MEREITFENNKGNKLYGILSNPNSNNNCPIIIMCHGLNSNKNSSTILELEKIFSKNNIASFRFDFFAHGNSEGDVDDRSVEEFVDNILNAIDFLKKDGYKNIGIFGISFGGVASVIAASRSSDLNIMALKSAGMGHTSRNMPNYKKDFDNKIWIKAGKKVKIHTLIIHGTMDEDVELQLAKELAESIKGSQLKLFEGADHKFSNEKDFKKCIKAVSDFIIMNINIV